MPSQSHIRFNAGLALMDLKVGGQGEERQGPACNLHQVWGRDLGRGWREGGLPSLRTLPNSPPPPPTITKSELATMAIQPGIVQLMPGGGRVHCKPLPTPFPGTSVAAQSNPVRPLPGTATPTEPHPIPPPYREAGARWRLAGGRRAKQAGPAAGAGAGGRWRPACGWRAAMAMANQHGQANR